MKKITIAIDGWAGTGKGTTAKGVAAALWYAYVDTGAMYRAVTVWLFDHDLIFATEQQIAPHLQDINIHFWSGPTEGKIFLWDREVTEAIRSLEVNEHVARIAAFLSIRTMLREKQRALAAHGGVVMDGRDMWSVVVPDAELKVFLSCSIDERARRRQAEMHAKGVEISLEIVKKNLQERDAIDYTGDTPTSEKAPDARELDTTYLTIDEQIGIVVGWAKDILE